MANQIDELEEAAMEARQDVAERRSTFPNICSNILMKTLKCDIKTAMTFKVDTGKENSCLPENKNFERLDKLGLLEERSLSYEKLGELEEQFTQVSKALNMIGKNKPKKMLERDQDFN